MILKGLAKDILTDLYDYAGTALILSVVLVFVYLLFENKGKPAKRWICDSVSIDSVRAFLFIFYLSLILCRTLLYRSEWAHPLARMNEGWGIYDKKGNLDLDGIENFILFIPMTALFWFKKCRKSECKVKSVRLTAASVALSFLLSLSIELCQIIFRIGTLQYSDLVYNTAGGLTGGLIYYILHTLKKHFYRSDSDIF